MDKIVGYVIGGAIALVFLYALSPVVFGFYEDTINYEVETDVTVEDEYPEVAAALLIVLVIFFLATAWKVYKSAM